MYCFESLAAFGASPADGLFQIPSSFKSFGEHTSAIAELLDADKGSELLPAINANYLSRLFQPSALCSVFFLGNGKAFLKTFGCALGAVNVVMPTWRKNSLAANALPFQKHF
jgi:hypothetical protein